MKFLSLIILILAANLPGNRCSLRKFKEKLTLENLEIKEKIDAAWILVSLANGNIGQTIPQLHKNRPAPNDVRNHLIYRRRTEKTKAIINQHPFITSSSDSSNDASEFVVDHNCIIPPETELGGRPFHDQGRVKYIEQTSNLEKIQGTLVVKKDSTMAKRNSKQIQKNLVTKKDSTMEKRNSKEIQKSLATKKDSTMEKRNSKQIYNTSKAKKTEEAKEQPKIKGSTNLRASRPKGTLLNLVDNVQNLDILNKGLKWSLGYFSTVYMTGKAHLRFAEISHGEQLVTIINGFFIATFKADMMHQKTLYNYYTRAFLPLAKSNMEANQLKRASDGVGLYAHMLKEQEALQVVNPPLNETFLIIDNECMVENVTKIGEYKLKDDYLIVLIPQKLENEELKKFNITAKDTDEEISIKIYELWKVDGMAVRYKTK